MALIPFHSLLLVCYPNPSDRSPLPKSASFCNTDEPLSLDCSSLWSFLYIRSLVKQKPDGFVQSRSSAANDSGIKLPIDHSTAALQMPFRHRQDGGDLSAVFIHAGAGYHSHGNEKFHLNAVNDAAKTAMTILRNGGTALDAVEMAVRVLEDREITNAGYGSNLTMEGLVECDATMVDHFGRSGAVGAVSRKSGLLHTAQNPP